MKNLLMCLILLTIVPLFMIGCGEEPDAPEGTLWFCVLKYKLTNKPIAAWASKKKPYISTWPVGDTRRLEHVYGYDNKGVTIFERRDMEKDLEEKIIDYSVMDVKKIIAEYPKYVDVWKGTILPGCEDVSQIDTKFESIQISKLRKELEGAREKLKLASKEVAVSVKRVETSVNRVGKSMENDYKAPRENNTPIRKTYTYSTRRIRGNDFKYRYHIIRSDGVDVWQTHTEMKADRLIPFLK